MERFIDQQAPTKSGLTNMGQRRNIILHYHIFKNAGSTLAAALERNFGKNFVQLHSPHHNERISGDALLAFVQAQPEVVAISSHHLSPPPPQTDGIRFHEVLILRDPLDRIRSMYDFYRRAEINEDDLTLEAKGLDLPDFLEYLLEKRSNLVTNAQTNLVANAGAKIPDDDDLARALTMLRAAAVVGVVEDFELCVLHAEHVLCPLFPHLDLSYVRENVTPLRAKDLESRLARFREVCGENTYRKLTASNALDMQLVTAAKAELLRRGQEINRQQVRLWSFRRRVQKRRMVHGVSTQFLRFRYWCGRAARLFSAQP